ncbi:MAG: glycosyltransferase, partial [Bdellovibrionales bacterium]|nr:glycosyltransferase [Bdellovibrionales bacterium]
GIEKLSFESRESLFLEKCPSAAELRQWEFSDLPHFLSSKTVVIPRDLSLVSGDLALKRVFDMVELYGVSSDLPPILYVLHEDIEGVVGGTELHTRDLVEAQKDERRIYVLFRSENSLILRFYFRGSEKKFVYSFSRATEQSLFSYPEMEQIFFKILSNLKIGIVHFQHLLGLPLSFLPIARRHCATTVTMNDYFLYCQNYDFLDERGQFCGVSRDPELCDRCIAKTQRPYRVGPTAGGQTYRRRYWLAEELQRHHIVYPSEDIRTRFLNLYPLAPERSFIIEPPSLGPRRKGKSKTSFPVLSIAYLGVFNHKKGAGVFRDLVLHLNKKFPDRIRWCVFGKVADPGMASFLLDQKNVSFFGEYKRSDLAGLFEANDIDLSLLLSVWPETYSFTLTESFLAGVPSIATEMGAQGSRVKNAGAGWTVDLSTAVEETEKIIQRIFDSPEELVGRQRRVPEILNYEDQIQRFRSYYSELLPQKNSLEKPWSQMNPTEADT